MDIVVERQDHECLAHSGEDEYESDHSSDREPLVQACDDEGRSEYGGRLGPLQLWMCSSRSVCSYTRS